MKKHSLKISAAITLALMLCLVIPFISPVSLSAKAASAGTETTAATKNTAQLAAPKVSYSTTYGLNKIKWKKISGAQGYKVYRSTSKNGTYKRIAVVKSGSTLYYKDYVSFSSTYYYKVISYGTANGKDIHSSYSNTIKVLNQLKKAIVYRADRMAETKIAVDFEPVSHADGYRIYRSTKKDGTYTRIADVTVTTRWSYLDTSKKRAVRYYYKVRAYKKVNGKKVFGRLSNAFAAQTWKESRMYYLFPDGVPKTSSQMQKYLTTIKVPVVDAKGNKSSKYLTVHKKLAAKYKMIFKEMAAAGIPVRKSDTGGYCWRKMTTANIQSHHSYGGVVDLNWNSNPFVYYGRSAYYAGYRPGKDPYSVTQKTVKIWKKYGFYWGGDWRTYKDYMHFTYTDH